MLDHKPSNVCLHWLHGHCQFGQDCGYIHIHGTSRGNKTRLPNNPTFEYRGKPLEDWDDEDLAPVCLIFAPGRKCKTGAACHFWHRGAESAGTRLIVFVLTLRAARRNQSPTQLKPPQPAGGWPNLSLIVAAPVRPALPPPAAAEARRLAALFRILARPAVVQRIAYWLGRGYSDGNAFELRAQAPRYLFVARRCHRWHVLAAASASRAFHQAFAPLLFDVVVLHRRHDLDLWRKRGCLVAVRSLHFQRDIAMGAVCECLSSAFSRQHLRSLELTLSPTMYSTHQRTSIARAIDVVSMLPEFALLSSLRLEAFTDNRVDGALQTDLHAGVLSKLCKVAPRMQKLAHLHLVTFNFSESLPVLSCDSLMTMSLRACEGSYSTMLSRVAQILVELHLTKCWNVQREVARLSVGSSCLLVVDRHPQNSVVRANQPVPPKLRLPGLLRMAQHPGIVDRLSDMLDEALLPTRAPRSKGLVPCYAFAAHSKAPWYLLQLSLTCKALNRAIRPYRTVVLPFRGLLDVFRFGSMRSVIVERLRAYNHLACLALRDALAALPSPQALRWLDLTLSPSSYSVQAHTLEGSLSIVERLGRFSGLRHLRIEAFDFGGSEAEQVLAKLVPSLPELGDLRSLHLDNFVFPSLSVPDQSVCSAMPAVRRLQITRAHGPLACFVCLFARTLEELVMDGKELVEPILPSVATPRLCKITIKGCSSTMGETLRVETDSSLAPLLSDFIIDGKAVGRI